MIYALLALLIFLFYRVLRNRTEKRSILQDQKRLRVINALGHAYSSISLVNLKTEEIEIVKSSKDMKPDQQGDILSKAHLEELIQQVIAEPFQEAYWEFVDMSTVAKRLEEHETLSFTAQTVDERWLTIIIVPQGYDKDGKLNTVLVANRDMTEEKEHEIEQDKNLRNALAAAEHANRAKTAFLNNMSHDIRTPMNAIIGFTALATTHIGSTELVLDYLKKIQTSSQHLLSLINDVLDMSRIESGSVRIEYTTVHLPDILHDLRTIIQGSVYSKQQDLYIDTQEEIEIVKSSKDMKPDQQGDILSKAHLEELIQQVIAEPFQEAYWEFVDMSTVAKRLEEHETLSFTAQTVDERWLTIIIVPQGYDKDGKLNTVLVANRDMTEEKEHEIEQDKNLRNALAAAEHANRAKTAFLNNMSHDIRTPMNAIIGFTALATTHIGSTELVLDYLKKIQTSSQHLLSLINDVLDMSRIESGSVRIEYTTVHLPDILHDLRTIIQGSVYSKQQDLYIDTQDVFHEDIIIDKLRLTQVLLNIISNAVKFTPVGGMINIRVSEKPCRREGYTTVIFSVKDNGIGMSPEFCKQVFDSFSREHTVTENGIGGTGLGMAITKNIVDMMGGTIQVESEVGKGTEFTVILECETSGVTVKREPIPELKGARALVVDDDAETCMSVSKMLREIEMTADWTTSGKEAVLRAREAYEQNQEFKVYIIDWLMPDMNGIETVRRIRMVVGPESPIIILTAYDWSDVEQEAREAGVTAFVSKPLFLSELREVLMSPEQRKLIQNENQKIQAASQTSYAGKKVLLVEDNELNREIATAIMEEIGLDVDVAEDGTDAVNIMSSERGNNYDLIFMDIQMPKMDGYTATREIRTLNNSKCANIPIIAMTANAFEEDRKKAIKAGMNGHIAKPISSDVILENLDQIFGR